MPCFSKSSLILSEMGEIPVEDLRPGDMIVTRGNGLQPVKWVGARHVSARHLFDNSHLRPVLIKKDTYGNGLPVRDTILSPNTRLPVDGAESGLFADVKDIMAPVKHLVDNMNVVQVEVTAANFVHVMFDEHEVIAINGIWTEVFKVSERPGSTLGNAQRNEIFEIFPELKATTERREARQERRLSVNRSRLINI